jgi:hypothetical protein
VDLVRVLLNIDLVETDNGVSLLLLLKAFLVWLLFLDNFARGVLLSKESIWHALIPRFRQDFLILIILVARNLLILC